jgi:hypothetical protein
MVEHSTLQSMILDTLACSLGMLAIAGVFSLIRRFTTPPRERPGRLALAPEDRLGFERTRPGRPLGARSVGRHPGGM